MCEIGVLIVVYHPDRAQLSSKLQLLGNDVSIAVVDNTPNEVISISQKNVCYIPLRENTGVANAQNVGIACLLKEGCRYIIFFDQDSVFSASYVRDIHAEYERLSKVHDKLFLLGPVVCDKETNVVYKALETDYFSEDDFVEQRELISSGTCVSVERIKEVGKLKAAMFIDYVDFEWCWRGESAGLVCGMTRRVTLAHKVGEGRRVIWGIPIIESAPFRYFYQYRNLVALCKLDYVPMAWKWRKVVRKIVELFVLPVISRHGRFILSNALHGVVAGLKFKI